jgi:hypothetical protein
MDERAFFSKGYMVRCPVWAIVNLELFEKSAGVRARILGV